MGRRILVIGGAGFIGSHLCEHLLRENEVFCVDNFSSGERSHIAHLISYPNFIVLNHNAHFPLHIDVDEIYSFIPLTFSPKVPYIEVTSKDSLHERSAQIFSAYGPRAPQNSLISEFIISAIENRPLYLPSEEPYPLCYASDLARGLEAFMRSGKKGKISLGNVQKFFLSDVAKNILQETRSNSPIISRSGNAPHFPDFNETEKILNWHPEESLASGIRKTVRYFMSQGL